MKTAIAAGILGVLCCLYTSVEGLTCLSCTSVSNIEDCVLSSATCTGDTEICYLDVIILPNLQKVYSAGCRAKDVCDLLGAVGKRDVSKRQAIACAGCCKDPVGADGVPCNGKLCNQNLTLPDSTCGVCDRVKNPEDCQVTQQCPPNEICNIERVFAGGNIIHKLGCQQKTLCDVTLAAYKDTHPTGGPPAAAGTTPVSGKREHGDIIICSACCNDARECNKKPCGEVIKSQQCTNSTICG